ncbi:MAG TPA: ABC transporter permease subunit, partial [Gaiellaceae bacterium]|nr:ABC transporter permease subunit [Gaiellaceae bacterium]
GEERGKHERDDDPAEHDGPRRSRQLRALLELLAASFLPTFGLSGPLWEHLTLDNYRSVLGSPQIAESIVNSFEIGTASATVVMVIAAVVAWLLVRSRIRGVGVLDQLASLPLVLPGVVLGIAVLVLYIRSPIPFYGTIWILVIAFVIAYLPFGLRYAHPGVLGIHPELEESAQLSGAPWPVMFRRVVVPLVLPALFAGWVFVFLLSVRELSAAALLYTQTSPVIATTMLDLWGNGNINEVTAFGTIVATLSIAVALITYRISRRFGLRV